MGMFEDILGQVLKSAVNQAGHEVGRRVTQPGPSQPGMPGGDPLTQILGGLLGVNQKGANPILVVVVRFIEANGGIMAVISKFQAKGMKAEADSWVGTGPNRLISAEQVTEVFDQKSLTELGHSLGTDSAGAADTVAKVLPEIVNQFSPQGTVPANEKDLLGVFLNLLLGARK